MGIFQRMRGMVRRWADDRRGNVAMILGLTMPILVLLTFGGVDIHRMATVRANLQDALDAAALAAARSDYTKDADLTRVGQATLKANLAGFSQIRTNDTDITFRLQDDEIVVADAKVDVKTIAAHIFLPPYGQLLDEWLPVRAHSEVNRATKDIEVAMVLDITGSMAGSRLTDLQSAAKDLVDLVVQDNQSINSTRMALVPYSMGVNAGSYANTVRGTPTGPTSVSGASWAVGSQKTIGQITAANPAVLTVNSHGFTTDDWVWVSGVSNASGSGSNMSTLFNTKIFQVVRVDDNTIRLKSGGTLVSTNNYKSYTASSGRIQKCQVSTCEVVVTTSTNHGLTTGDDVRITGVEGMTQINTQTGVSPSGSAPFYLRTTVLTNTTFALNGVLGPNTTAWTRRGAVQCLEYGCLDFLFTNNDGNLRVYDSTDCISERVGPNAYKDVSTSTTPLSFLYTGTTNVGQGGCMSTTFTPLTTNKTTLKNAINGYAAEGGTAGQIGVGWGWYMVSPTFSSIFPADQRPAAYGTRNLLKVVIIMTDGEFNAVYYDGVRARDSGTGGGSNDRWINHDSNNGNPFQQSADMCDAMKQQNIIIYTVGFDIADGNNNTAAIDSAQDVMRYCATGPDYVYLPDTGASLKSAFAAIGRSISQLRISK